jgi:hypothetical protein
MYQSLRVEILPKQVLMNLTSARVPAERVCDSEQSRVAYVRSVLHPVPLLMEGYLNCSKSKNFRNFLKFKLNGLCVLSFQSTHRELQFIKEINWRIYVWKFLKLLKLQLTPDCLLTVITLNLLNLLSKCTTHCSYLSTTAVHIIYTLEVQMTC